MLRNTLTCREATRLLLEDEDREIAPADRLALQVHVKICHGCQRFLSQLNFLRRATKAWRHHGETGGETDAKSDANTDPDTDTDGGDPRA